MIGGGVDPVDAEADHNGEFNNEEEPAAVDIAVTAVLNIRRRRRRRRREEVSLKD